MSMSATRDVRQLGSVVAPFAALMFNDSDVTAPMAIQ
jgi:hypothetical protein